MFSFFHEILYRHAGQYIEDFLFGKAEEEKDMELTPELENFLDGLYEEVKKHEKDFEVGEVHTIPVELTHDYGSTEVELEFYLKEDGIDFPNRNKQLDKIANRIFADIIKD